MRLWPGLWKIAYSLPKLSSINLTAMHTLLLVELARTAADRDVSCATFLVQAKIDGVVGQRSGARDNGVSELLILEGVIAISGLPWG